MKNIILFASGSGTNAENIVNQFANSPSINVAALFCNNPNAGVIDRMNNRHIPVHLFDKKTFQDADKFLSILGDYKPDLIVLAGFLWLVPEYLVKQFEGKIINIHPALLPKFGGKGMYGHHVHEAVLSKGEKEHGITIHFVNEKYDDGNTIVQAKFDVMSDDTLSSIQAKIAQLEMHYYPEAIKRILHV